MPPVTMLCMGLRLTPQGHLIPDVSEGSPTLKNNVATRLAETFAQGSGPGLIWLGAEEVGQNLPPVLNWWRDFAAQYVGALCLRSTDTALTVPLPNEGELATLVLTGPVMPGAEYLNQDILKVLWEEMNTAFSISLAASKMDIQSFLKSLNPAWNMVGRVHFNLAENRRDPDLPFAFLATALSGCFHLSGRILTKHA